MTRSAALTFASRALQQGARLLTQFIVTPLLIQGLGMPLYGAWMMIQQAMGYIGMGDIRPAAALKISLSVRQHVSDVDEKRRLVGAALRVTTYTLPLIMLCGSAIAWFSPHFIRVGPEHAWSLRLAMAIAIANFTIERYTALPSNILVGLNLDYRSMGMSAVSVLVTGVLMIAALRAGLGLPGLALAATASSLLFNLVRFVVARRAVPWLGSSKPTRTELKDFARMSAGISMAGFGHLVMIGTDILVVGFALGPAAAGMYAATGAVLRFGVAPLTEALNAGGAGLADLCGRREWARLTRVRAEMHLVSLTAMSVVGFVIIALNRHFLLIWSKTDVYAGSAVNFMLVLLIVCGVLYNTDRTIAVSLFELRVQTLALVVGGVLALIVGGIVAAYQGAAAIPAALTCAFIVELLVVGRVIRRHTGAPKWEQRRLLARPLAVLMLLFAAGLWVEHRIAPETWTALIGWGVLLTTIAVVVVAVAGLSSQARAILMARLAAASKLVRKSAGRR